MKYMILNTILRCNILILAFLFHAFYPIVVLADSTNNTCKQMLQWKRLNYDFDAMNLMVQAAQDSAYHFCNSDPTQKNCSNLKLLTETQKENAKKISNEMKNISTLYFKNCNDSLFKLIGSAALEYNSSENLYKNEITRRCNSAKNFDSLACENVMSNYLEIAITREMRNFTMIRSSQIDSLRDVARQYIMKFPNGRNISKVYFVTNTLNSLLNYSKTVPDRDTDSILSFCK